MDNNLLDINSEKLEDDKTIGLEPAEITEEENDRNLSLINSNNIKDLIYTIRGEQVMVDSDLAILYEVSTKRLNEQVKRNIERFPEKFMFRLTDDEYSNLRSQFATSSSESNYGGRRYNPYVFNQQGVAMLSAVLKSNVAIQISIKIMDAFVEMRSFLLSNRDMFTRLNNLEINQLKQDTKLEKIEIKQIESQKIIDDKLNKVEQKFEQVFDYIAEKSEVSQKIFFDGQIYDAFSLLIDIVKKAKKSIILIDNYVGIDTLNILSKRNDGVAIIIYTTNKSKLTTEDIKKFNKQYKNLVVKKIATFHDRFMILDENYGYLIGASIKDAGNKSFGITKIEDDRNIKDILRRLED